MIELKQHNRIFSSTLPNFSMFANGKQISSFSACKAYCQDVMTAYYLGINAIDSGYDGEPVDLNNISILFSYNNKEFNVETCLDLIHQLESSLSMIPTILEKIELPKGLMNGLVFKGDKGWLCSPPMISLYTLLIRIGIVHIIGDSFERTFERIITGKTKASYEDVEYVSKAVLGIEKLIKHGHEAIFGPSCLENFDSTLFQSHSMGIADWSKTMYNNTYCPRWSTNLTNLES